MRKGLDDGQERWGGEGGFPWGGRKHWHGQDKTWRWWTEVINRDTQWGFVGLDGFCWAAKVYTSSLGRLRATIIYSWHHQNLSLLKKCSPAQQPETTMPHTHHKSTNSTTNQTFLVCSTPNTSTEVNLHFECWPRNTVLYYNDCQTCLVVAPETVKAKL